VICGRPATVEARAFMAALVSVVVLVVAVLLPQGVEEAKVDV
jgi:hypothetical protein